MRLFLWIVEANAPEESDITFWGADTRGGPANKFYLGSEYVTWFTVHLGSTVSELPFECPAPDLSCK